LARGQDDPKTMMKISMRIVEPPPQAGSFAAEPRTCWRAGTRFARIAEALDSQNKIHALWIIREPDAWVINLFDKTAKHVVDSGPSRSVHIPIFQTPEGDHADLKELEFGNEFEFFTKHHAKRSSEEHPRGQATDRYEVALDGQRRKLILWTAPGSNKPTRVSLIDGTKTRTIEYLTYEDDLPFDASIFQVPAGIRVEVDK